MRTSFAINLSVVLVIASCASPSKRELSVADLTLVGNFSQPSGSGDFLESMDDAGGTLRIKRQVNITASEAEVERREKEQMLMSLLHPGPDPYFGARPAAPTCENLPVTRHDSFGSIFYLYATANFVFGSCTEAMDVQKAQLIWLYCPRAKAAYEIQYFYPARESWRLTPVARCRS